MSEPIVYIDHSEIRAGRLEDVKTAIHELAEFVETHEPQLIGYGFYMSDDATRMTVVAIHPDAASLEFHMETVGPALRKFTELVNLRTIEVYGRPSEKVLDQLRQKSELLGENGTVVVHGQHAGFMRLASAIP